MYELRFDDGEFIGRYDNLDDLQNKLDYVFHHYISRYAIPYKDGNRISISEERKKLEGNSRTQNSIDWNKLKNFDFELDGDPGVYLVLKSPERFAKNVIDALNSGKTWDYNVFRGIEDDVVGFVDVHEYLDDLDSGKLSSESIFFDEVDRACGEEGELLDFMADNDMIIPVGNYKVTGITTEKELDKFNKKYPRYAAKIEVPSDMSMNSRRLNNSDNSYFIPELIIGDKLFKDVLINITKGGRRPWGDLMLDIFISDKRVNNYLVSEIKNKYPDNVNKVKLDDFGYVPIYSNDKPNKELDNKFKKIVRDIESGKVTSINIPLSYFCDNNFDINEIKTNSRKSNSNMEFKFDPNKYYIVWGSRFQGKIGIGFVNGPYNTESDAVKVLNDKFGSIRKDIGTENDFVSVEPGSFVEKYDPNKSSYYTSDVDSMAQNWREFVDVNYENNSKSNLNKSITTNSKKMKKLSIKSRNYNSRRGRVRKFNSVVDLVGQEVEVTENDEVMEGTVESVEVNKDNEVTVELDGGDKVILEPSEAAELIDKGEVVTEETEETTPTEVNCNEYKIARNCTYKNGKKVRKVASVTAPTLEEAISAVETKDKADDIEAEGYEELVEQLPEKSNVTINSDIEEEILVEPENPEVVETPMEPEVPTEPVVETPMEPEMPEDDERQSNSFKGVADYVKRAYGIDLNKDNK
jgi:antitoxin component of MazEF toxin-antitoxin module